MSPSETVPSLSTSAVSDVPPFSLEDYEITRNGFLPAEQPLARLSHPHYSPWEQLMESLPTSLADKSLRQQVDQLPVLSTDYLTAEPEWRRACVILGFLAHAYVWGGETAAEVLPPQITVPLLAVTRRLGMPPVATYACVNLWNFCSAAGDPRDLDSLRALHTFTGTEDESWFYVVSVAMEACGGDLIPTVLRALEALAALAANNSTTTTTIAAFTTPERPPAGEGPQTEQTRTRGEHYCDHEHDYRTALAGLDEITRSIGHIGALLERMHERCDPRVFYHRIRPFLAGSKNMAAAGLPRGVFYDETGGGRAAEGIDQGRGGPRGRWRQLRGGSNGQSSLIQLLDVALGVEHAPGGTPGSRSDGKAEVGRGEEQVKVPKGDEVKGEEGKGSEEGHPGRGNGVDDVMSFHREVREYMPEPHRRFLEHVSERYPGGMRKVIAGLLAAGGSEGGTAGLLRSSQRAALQEAFHRATQALAEFRNKHLQIVARYIIIPSRQPNNGERGLNLATASSRLGCSAETEGRKFKGLAAGGGELTGTGGTALLPFLKQSRDETLEAGELQVPCRATPRQQLE